MAASYVLPPYADQVVTVPNSYPCCGHQVRFTLVDTNHERRRKRCHRCGTVWEIHRQFGDVVDGAHRRLDYIDWSKVEDE